MKKNSIMMIATILIILLTLPSIVQATVVHYWWDNVYFVDGTDTDIDYAHPDNVYYGISPSSDWTIQGRDLYHHQIKRDTSYAIVIGVSLFIDIVALVLGAKLGGSSTAYYVAGLATIVISTFIGMVIDYYFVDERGCIWWWIGSIFMAYLEYYLPYLSGVTKEVALAAILSAFVCYGYLRVGKVTFYDPISKGAPEPPCSLSISTTLWGRTIPCEGTYSYEHDTRATVYAVPWDDCVFDYWSLDGTIKYGTPITITMDTSHSLKAYFHNANPTGCPYVYTWNGQGYTKDNNLLPASEISNGADVEDYYKLEQPFVPTYQHTTLSLYSMQIREFEQEHNYFDQVKLLAIDHSSDVNITITQDGEILTYRNPLPPLSCFDNNETNRLSEISKMDGNTSNPATYFDGYFGDYLVLNFGKVDSNNAKLILRTDWIKEKECILVQMKDENDAWQTVEVLIPRNYWSIQAVNLASYVNKNKDLTVRLFWKYHHRLDYVGLDTTPQDSFEIHYATLISAIHSSEGNVRRRLLENDQTYAELTPGQQIQLTFLLPNNQNQKRTFILYTEGHYTTIET